jgi:hypothetical protein
MIAMSIALSLYAASALAAGPSCKETATEKKLAGAALTSFMTKCEKGGGLLQKIDKKMGY